MTAIDRKMQELQARGMPQSVFEFSSMLSQSHAKLERELNKQSDEKKIEIIAIACLQLEQFEATLMQHMDTFVQREAEKGIDNYVELLRELQDAELDLEKLRRTRVPPFPTEKQKTDAANKLERLTNKSNDELAKLRSFVQQKAPQLLNHFVFQREQ